MQIITNVVKVDSYDYYVKHLEILNVMLPEKLSQKEVEVLAAFMDQDKSLIEDDMFNGVVRKKVMDKLSLKQQSIHTPSSLLDNWATRKSILLVS